MVFYLTYKMTVSQIIHIYRSRTMISRGNMKRTLILILIAWTLLPVVVYDAEAEDQVSSGKIEISSDWEGPPVLVEDDSSRMMTLSGPDGMFNDSIGEIISIKGREYRFQDWSDFIDGSILQVDIENVSGIWRGYIEPNLDQYGNSTISIRVETSSSGAEFDITIPVKAVNDPPSISFPTGMYHARGQFQNLSMVAIISDPDPEDEFDVKCNMLINLTDDVPSITNQLLGYEPERGKDFDLDLEDDDIPRLWWELHDQSIWKDMKSSTRIVEVTIQFKVWDLAGESDTCLKRLDLQDVNEEPERPEYILTEYDSFYVDEPVNFWTEQVTDPDGDMIIYNWDFGDGTTAMGMNVTHTFTIRGDKTIQLWVEDGNFSTEKINLRIMVNEGPPRPSERDSDHDGYFDDIDMFDYDPAAHKDTDRDGYPDYWNTGMTENDSVSGLKLDLYPKDPFMNGHVDPDMDGDGTVDGYDAFPMDPAASTDVDHDGYPDYWNFGMDEDDSTEGLKIDHYPRDPDRNGYERTFLERKGLYLIIVVIVALMIILIGSLMVMALIRQNGRS